MPTDSRHWPTLRVALPSLPATEHAIALAFTAGTSPASLRLAYAKLTIFLSTARSGRLPTAWTPARNPFRRGWAQLNAEKACERIERRLGPLEFWVEERPAPDRRPGPGDVSAL